MPVQCTGPRHTIVIDWHDPENNSFLITEELELVTSDGTRTRRPDMVG